MTSHMLTLRSLHRESDLQALINGWASRPSSWRIVAPEWFRALPAPRPRRRLGTSLGYTFEPDAVFDTPAEVLVAEFKLAPQGKYESLALPEVLHHAWMLQHDETAARTLGDSSKPVTPLILTPFNSWLVASMRFLMEHGLRPDAVRLLAFEAFEQDGRRFLWAADPFAKWHGVADPPPLLAETFPDLKHWYRVDGEATWFGLPALCGERPAFITAPHVEAAAVEESEAFIACAGSYSSGWTYSLLRAQR